MIKYYQNPIINSIALKIVEKCALYHYNKNLNHRRAPLWEPLVYRIKRCPSKEPFWPRSQLLKNSLNKLKRLIGYFTRISWQSHSFLSVKSLTGLRTSVAIILSCLLKVIALIEEYAFFYLMQAPSELTVKPSQGKYRQLSLYKLSY